MAQPQHQWRLVFLLATCTQAAFSPGQIRWGGLSGKRFVLAPVTQDVPSTANGNFQTLTVVGASGERFVAQPDNTIALDGKNLCIEAAGGPDNIVVLGPCTGRASQKWSWLFSGQIQLKETNRCLDVVGKSVQLRECNNEMTWKFEDQSPMLGQAQPTASMKYTMIYLASMFLFGMVSTGWLWRLGQKTRAPPLNQLSVPLDAEQGGISFIERAVISGTTSGAAVPGVTAISPVAPQRASLAQMSLSPDDLSALDPHAIVQASVHAANQVSNLIAEIVDADGERAYGSVDAPLWVAPVGGIAVIATALLPVLLRPGEEALFRMQEEEADYANGKRTKAPRKNKNRRKL